MPVSGRASVSSFPLRSQHLGTCMLGEIWYGRSEVQIHSISKQGND